MRDGNGGAGVKQAGAGDTAPGPRWPRAVAHFDLDAAFAAIEQLERPELRGRPLVVGGDPSGRGVVSTASYEARVYGIHSAMPARQARQLCPDAIFIRPRMDVYRDYSRRVFAIVRDCATVVEQAGIDEGYLDLDEAEDPLAVAVALKARVRAEVGLSVSVGLAPNKLVAKIASDLHKPDGLTVVPPGLEAATLAPLPARRLPGVGPRTAAWLAEMGVHTIGALAGFDAEQLRAHLGASHAADLLRRARGESYSLVQPVREPRSISDETTFARDEADGRVLWSTLHAQAAHCAGRLRAKGLVARSVGVKLRYADFRTISRTLTLAASTDEPAVVAEAVAALMRRTWRPAPHPLRLVGVRVAGLQAAPTIRQLHLDW